MNALGHGSLAAEHRTVNQEDHCRFETSAVSLSPLCLCLSEETKSQWSLLPGLCQGKSNILLGVKVFTKPVISVCKLTKMFAVGSFCIIK